MTNIVLSLAEASLEIVKEADPAQKVKLARQVYKSWHMGAMLANSPADRLEFPNQPGRPPKPDLLDRRDMPRRRAGSKAGLIALVHSLVHIELNAIDMAFDLIARFSEIPLPHSFLDGALKVAHDEARHFEMINNCLEQLGAKYGDLPAHGGLWEATRTTSHDLLARLAIVPLVLEARGLDVSPKMIAQVKATDALGVANVMEVIYQDEITHVAFGVKWFKYICQQQQIAPHLKFRELVEKYFRGSLKPPFNKNARDQAGLTTEFYAPITDN